MPDAVTGNLRPTPDFQGLIEATPAVIREQMEERLADRMPRLPGSYERRELRRLVIDAQAAEWIARDEAAGLPTWLDQLQARGLWEFRKKS